MKIFLSHSSVDKPIVDKFVDKILRLSCGFNISDIVYTSMEETGVRLGESIPSFIKDNLQTSDIVFCFISENYKRSEVCLNEMGAAWALNKKIISLLLPGITFNSLGWLTSFEKAICLNDSAGLDCLYNELVDTPNVMLWNRQKDEFLAACRIGQKQCCFDTDEKEKIIKDKKLTNLQVFDVKFYIRAVSAGEYHYQLDLRLRANIKINLKNIYIKNKFDFLGSVSHPKKELSFKSFITQGILDINSVDSDEFKRKIKEELFIGEESKVLDYKIDKEEQKSISLVGGFNTIRECDGYCECPINNWFLKVTYNIDEYIEVPISLTMLGERGYFLG